MPVIAYFFVIYIRMYHGDHSPAHIHAEYQGHEAFISIETDEVFEGHFPRKAARIVRDLIEDHRDELLENGYERLILSLFNAFPEPIMIFSQY